MKGIRIYLREELEKRLREAVARRYGFVRGGLSRSVEEAIYMWLQDEPIETDIDIDMLIEELRGSAKADKDGVTLQKSLHELLD